MPTRRRIDDFAQDVMASANQLLRLSDSELLDVARIEEDRSFSQLLPVVVEAVRRTHGFALHPVQIFAALQTAAGKIIEMQTGEGKTVVTGAAALLSALSGKTTHVATTNAYLAERDFESMAETFAMLDVDARLLPTEMNPIHSRRAYDAEITYGPGYQFGFDFLFDQITLRQHNPNHLGRAIVQQLNGFQPNEKLVQCRMMDVCIVDEADSVLVDEATTPLILSFETDDEISELPLRVASAAAAQMVVDEHFRLTPADKKIEMTDAGKAFAKAFRRTHLNGNVNLQRPWESYVKSALHANHFLIRDQHYVVQNGEVNIVDQFTGRIFDDRSWQSGLHQAVEMKEDVAITTPRVSKARVTRQRFMGFYQNLCGLTGTALGARRDFQEFYSVDVTPVPTHRVCQRKRLRARFFIDQSAKIEAIVAETLRRHQTGQPILIGTSTIGESINLHDAFSAAELSAVVLNGLQDRDEADIVAAAGRSGSITIATNMAGRGTDIKLDDNAVAAGGLHVIGAAPNASARIDRQLEGRAARQGQPGSAQFFISADDDLLATHGTSVAKRIVANAGKRNGETTQDFSRAIAAVQLARDHAQFIGRKEMVMHDRWMDSVRASVFGETIDE